jgi:hypothetical protein
MKTKIMLVVILIFMACGESKEDTQSREELSSYIRQLNSIFQDFKDNRNSEMQCTRLTLHSYYLTYTNRLGELRQSLAGKKITDKFMPTKYWLDSTMAKSNAFLNERKSSILVLAESEEFSTGEELRLKVMKDMLSYFVASKELSRCLDSANYWAKQSRVTDTLAFRTSVLDTTDFLRTTYKAITEIPVPTEVPALRGPVANWMPSEVLEKYISTFFEFSYPDNFEFTSPKKGSYDFVMEMKANRMDCTIHVDVFGAKGLSVNKVVDRNKGTYKGAPVETKIDGNKAFYINYTPSVAQIKSRVYFVVKNDKVIRTTLNWYQPQSEIYLGAFEKCISSMKLK